MIGSGTPQASTAQSSPTATSTPALSDWVRLLRPVQWSKNTFVLVALLFSGQAFNLPVLGTAMLAFAAFCLAASAVYAFNDVIDRREDREHPLKCRRPVAAGRISPLAASVAAALMAVMALGVAELSGRMVMLWIGAYLALNVAYSRVLKTIVLLDVFCIAAFFLIRLLTGAAAVHVKASMWLLVCGGLLSLYLGFAKRRHELTTLGDGAAAHRGVLREYDAALLDQISGVLLSVTIVAYLMFTLTSETAKHVGSDALSYGTAFVIFGVFRYLYLVHRRGHGTPTETIFGDRPLLVTVLLWGAYSAWLIYRPLT
jgi:4-hydroxybenzoate polyprenyltransferase